MDKKDVYLFISGRLMVRYCHLRNVPRLFTPIVENSGQGSAVVRLPLHHPSGLNGGVQYSVT